MPRHSVKAQLAAELIRKRILHGDHKLHGIPSERILSEELGISRETLRRAIRLLEQDQLLTRLPNGRLAPLQAENQTTPVVIGLVKHCQPCHDQVMWEEAARAVLAGRDCVLRTVTFEHFGEPAIASALGGFEGVFFVPPAQQIPPWLLTKMSQSKARVTVLGQDVTESGIPSVTLFPPQAERKLLEHLMELGHQRIDCLNTQICDPVIQARIAVWRSFLDEHRFMGQLHSLLEFRPMDSGYQLVKSRLRDGTLLASALVCTTAPAAMGAIRACYEEGITVGEDLSICTINDEGLAPFLIPSLTCLKSAPKALYLEKAVQWILTGSWVGPLLIQPEEVPIFRGNSTGAPAKGASCPRG